MKELPECENVKKVQYESIKIAMNILICISIFCIILSGYFLIKDDNLYGYFIMIMMGMLYFLGSYSMIVEFHDAENEFNNCTQH